MSNNEHALFAFLIVCDRTKHYGIRFHIAITSISPLFTFMILCLYYAIVYCMAVLK